ncbi:DUF1615 domain-containing protein [Lysobacter solisilvae (ex Woo and Kim 2020)]|uniref:DUF1615 domain-containing protein n=1 Tax=Agrilutibacter terrestris TaxID=2865112 RepID=A0A7H0FVC5_9GAMM|nr:DUF1615 domain-containing protein [Lysobacter terrestris]QNP39991.1 DUF1615 domain-containing protein [Lysobacter terrestris]
MPAQSRFHRFALFALGLGIAGLSACDTGPTPEAVRAELVRRIPRSVPDRAGWARDIQAAFAAQEIEPSTSNLCAVLAVVEQESTYRADPPVPGLPTIARGEIDRRAARLHVPAFMVDAALEMRSPDGRTYAERIDALRTEQQLSALFEEMIQRVPLGRRLLRGFNPVRTGGPMQVSIAFAERNARGYPYPLDGSIRHEVFSRRGGLYFGIRHLLAYPAHYTQPLHRFADFNAGWYASRNAAFQRAVSLASGRALVYDGDLLAPGAPMDRPGTTEAALRDMGASLGMDAATIRAALQRGRTLAFEDTALYRDVYALAERKAGGPLARARLPQIDLSSPKITRKLTTAWFADRVNGRWKQCMAR